MICFEGIVLWSFSTVTLDINLVLLNHKAFYASEGAHEATIETVMQV